MSKLSEGFIFVRYYGGTYIARFRGKTSSCTAGPEQAARAVARKVMGDTTHTIEICGNETVWQVVSQNTTDQALKNRAGSNG